MLIAFIIILILGFINSKFWFLFLFLIAYFLLTMNYRSKKAVESRVIKMIVSGKTKHHYSELFFEAAEEYARKNGSISRSENNASCVFSYESTEYLVSFARVDKLVGGGTYILVENYQDFKETHDF